MLLYVWTRDRMVRDREVYSYRYIDQTKLALPYLY